MKTGASRGDCVLRTLWRTRLKDGSQDLGWKAGSDGPQEPGLRPASWAGRQAQTPPRSQRSGLHPGLERGLRLPPGPCTQASILLLLLVSKPSSRKQPLTSFHSACSTQLAPCQKQNRSHKAPASVTLKENLHLPHRGLGRSLPGVRGTSSKRHLNGALFPSPGCKP